jgi:chemotaxis protein CheD
MEDTVYEVGMSEYKIAESPIILISSGIGSCLTIALYDRTKKIGGMAHAMLPEEHPNEKDDEDSPARYVDKAIKTLVSEMESLGCNRKNFVAKIAGGANMFAGLGEYSKEIGVKNVFEAKKILAEMNIEIVAENTGGTSGRHVEFDVSNGLLSIISKI